MRCVPLGAVCQIFMGQAPDGASYNEEGNGCPLIAGAGDFGARTPKPKKFTTQPIRVSESGDIILCIRATIGDLNWSDKSYCLGRGVAGLRPYKKELDRFYLWHFINDNKQKLEALGTGSTFKQISRHDISSFEIPLPPLDEQRRIAAILDKADAIRRKRQESIHFTEEYIRSTFLEMFGDPVTNPKGVKVVQLSDITTKITDGVHQKPNYTDSGVPFISVKDITTGRLKFDNCKYVSLEDHQKFTKRCKAERFDILYTKVGATYGRPALVDTDREFSLYVSVCLIKPQKKLVDPFYLNAVLGTSAIKNQADKRIKGIGVPDLHLDQIQKFLIPLPTMQYQSEFARCVAAIEKLKSSLRVSLAEFDMLSNAFTQRAFRGEL